MKSKRDAAVRKRRRFQFSLRSLMLLVLFASLAMSWLATRIERTQKEDKAVERLRGLGAYVWYEHDYPVPGPVAPGMPSPGPGDRAPPGPAWLRGVLGEHFFATVDEVCFGSSVDDAAFEQLSALRHFRGLSLHGEKVTDATLEHLKGFTQLQELGLRRAKITDAGLRHLKGLTQLRQLDLSHTRVTNAGLEHLKGLTNLLWLNVDGTQVTDEGMNRLRQSSPKCGRFH